jgi:branched-chain amino acid transport system permease protein
MSVDVKNASLGTNLQGTFFTIVGLIAGLIGFSVITTLADGGGINTVAITIISGLFVGMLLFLVAAGFSIIFGLMDVLNLAQGAFFAIGAYVGLFFHHDPRFAFLEPNLRFVVGVILATIVGTLLGVFMERVLLRPLYERPIFQIVLTFGVGIVIGEILKLLFGVQAYAWISDFPLNDARFIIFEQQLGVYRPFVILIGFVMVVSIALLLQRTRIGIIIRAGVEDDEMVEALGINVRFVFTSIFALGCAMAAFGGAIGAPFLGANLAVGQQYLLGAIAVVVLGGLGSYEGTAIGSVLVGLAIAVVSTFSTQYLNQTVWSSIMPMLLLVLVLLLKPSGLFGKER